MPVFRACCPMSELSLMKWNNSPGSNSPAPWAIYVLLLCLPLPVQAEDTSSRATQLINQMSRASKELNYDGIFVYRRGNRIDTLRLIHKNDEQGEKERMLSLTGPAREVIRDGESVTCIFPDHQAVMVERGHPKKLLAAQLPEPVETIADYYTFSIAGKDRVAGRDTWMINIVPKDDYRFGYQLWIDEQSSLLMKSELKDGSGWPIEQILFTKLDILDEIPDKLLKPAISGKDYTWYSSTVDAKVQAVSDRQWKVTSMPAGFSMSQHETRGVAKSGMPVEHMVYSDGLAMVSVFVEKIENRPETLKSASRIGGVNTYAIYADGYQVTAVGEVPQKTVRLFAGSVLQSR